MDKLKCRRYERGQDYESYFIDHTDFGVSAGEAIILKDPHGMFHVTLLLTEAKYWTYPAFESQEDDDKSTWEMLVVDKLIMEAIESWGGGKFFFSIHYTREGNNVSGEI
jgi:hypothetical protein